MKVAQHFLMSRVMRMGAEVELILVNTLLEFILHLGE